MYGQIGSFSKADNVRKGRDTIELSCVPGTLLCCVFIGSLMYVFVKGLPFGGVDYDATLLPQTTLALPEMTRSYARALTIMGAEKGDVYLCQSTRLASENIHYRLEVQKKESGRTLIPLNLNKHSMLKFDVQTTMEMVLVRGFSSLKRFLNNNKFFSAYARPSRWSVIQIRFDDHYFWDLKGMIRLSTYYRWSTETISGHVDIEATVHDLSKCFHVCKFNPDKYCTVQLATRPSGLTPVLKGSDDLTYLPLLKFKVARVMTMRRFLEVMSLVIPLVGAGGLFSYFIYWCFNERLRKSGLSTNENPFGVDSEASTALLQTVV
ncbi:hypothetical protein GEMRC1_010745 [Eukaryota sp. GEM-RC1]